MKLAGLKTTGRFILYIYIYIYTYTEATEMAAKYLHNKKKVFLVTCVKITHYYNNSCEEDIYIYIYIVICMYIYGYMVIYMYI